MDADYTTDLPIHSPSLQLTSPAALFKFPHQNPNLTKESLMPRTYYGGELPDYNLPFLQQTSGQILVNNAGQQRLIRDFFFPSP